MKLSNAIKKIEEKGYKVQYISGERNILFRAIIGAKRDLVLEFYASEGTIDRVGVRNINDHSDPMSDYCAFVFFDNLTQALRCNA